MLYCKLQYNAALDHAIRLLSIPVAEREDVMLTQAERCELQRHIADLLNDTGLPQYLKVNRLAELLEERFMAREIPAFEEPLPVILPPDCPPARKQPARKPPARRKNAKSTHAAASARKEDSPNVCA